MEPRRIRTDDELDAALAAPRFLLFKHSRVCPTSGAAFEEYEQFHAARADVPTAWLDVLGSAPLSRRAAAATGVTHESPQALWIVGGRVVWHASHEAITARALAAATAVAAPDETTARMWVLVAGPYRSGTQDAAGRAANLAALNRAAAEVFDRGHVPIVGVNLALPVVVSAGEARYDEILQPLSNALAERCDAVLRIGGPSRGADAEVEIVARRSGRVFRSAAEIPRARPA